MVHTIVMEMPHVPTGLDRTTAVATLVSKENVSNLRGPPTSHDRRDAER